MLHSPARLTFRSNETYTYKMRWKQLSSCPELFKLFFRRRFKYPSMSSSSKRKKIISLLLVTLVSLSSVKWILNHKFEQRSSAWREGFYVVTLENVTNSEIPNSGRLHSFKRHVGDLCGTSGPPWTVIHGHINPRRGAGLTQAFVEILQHANHERLDKIFIFEDDARFLNSLFCDIDFRQFLAMEEPDDAFVTVFAAHNAKKSRTVETNNFVFEGVYRSFGSYAWSITRQNFMILASYWGALLDNGSNDQLSPDMDLSRAHSNSTTYILRMPQLVTHPAGYSNTWSKVRPQVDDIEKVSLVLDRKSSSNLHNITRYMAWTRTLKEIIVPEELKEHLIQEKENHALELKSFNDTVWEAALRASSNIVVVLRESIFDTHSELLELRSSFLRTPYNILTKIGSCASMHELQELKLKPMNLKTSFILQRRLLDSQFHQQSNLLPSGCIEEKLIMRSRMSRFYTVDSRKPASRTACFNYSPKCFENMHQHWYNSNHAKHCVSCDAHG